MCPVEFLTVWILLIAALASWYSLKCSSILCVPGKLVVRPSGWIRFRANFLGQIIFIGGGAFLQQEAGNVWVPLCLWHYPPFMAPEDTFTRSCQLVSDLYWFSFFHYFCSDGRNEARRFSTISIPPQFPDQIWLWEAESQAGPKFYYYCWENTSLKNSSKIWGHQRSGTNVGLATIISSQILCNVVENSSLQTGRKATMRSAAIVIKTLLEEKLYWNQKMATYNLVTTWTQTWAVPIINRVSSIIEFQGLS